MARILFFKIRPSQEILKIRDGTPLEAEEILTYIKKPSKRSCKLDIPCNVVQKKRVARILFFKIKPSQEILKIRDGIPLEAEEIMTYIKSPRNGSVYYFSSKLDVPSNVVQKKKVARILLFKIKPSQEILKIRDGIPLEAEEIMTYIKSPRNGSVCYFSSKLDVPSNVVQKKRVARILFFKIRPSQEILKIRDGIPLEAEEILTYIKSLEMDRTEEKSGTDSVFKIRPSQEILKIRDGIPLEAEEIMTYIKSPRNGSVCYFSSKLDVPSNVVQKKKVARILLFKIMPSQEILKIRDGTPLEAEEILTYIKKPSKRICLPSQEILKIRDGTPLEAEEILTYIKKPSKRSVCYLYRKFDVPSNVVQKKTVARILFSKIRPSQEILKIRDVQKKRVARILFFKIKPSQEILKIRDGIHSEAEEIMTYIKSPRNGSSGTDSVFKIRPSQEILKIRDGIPLEAKEIMTYIKSPRNGSVCYFSSKLDVPSNVVQKKKVARILLFKIMPSQEILKIRDGTPLEAEEILTYIKKPSKRICLPSQEILKIRDGTPLEAEEILTYIKKPSKRSVCYLYRKFDVPSNVVQKKTVARILFSKISKLDIPCNVVQKKRVARILFFKIRPSQEILKIRDGTPLEAEEILTYIKSPRNGFVCYFSSNLDVPSNVVHKKRVALILFFKIRPSQEILKIRDGTPLEAEEILTYIKKPSKRSVCYLYRKFDVPSNVVQKKTVARILFFKIRPSQEILKIRDGTPLEAEEILTYIKKPSKRSVCYLYRKFDVPSNVVQKKTVARILFSKIRPSQEI
ncbi:hypothetical protein OROHE_004061 [Orobanche hederae]